MKPQMTIDLFNKYHKQLVYFIKSLVVDEDDAYDVASGCFEKIIPLDFKSIADARYFLFGVAKNEAFNFLKAKSRRHKRESTNNFESCPLDADAKLIKSEVLQWLNEKRLNLPEQRRIIFDLLFLEHLSVNEIAVKLNLSPDTIRVQKSKIVWEFKIFNKNRYLRLHSSLNGKKYTRQVLKGGDKDRDAKRRAKLKKQ